MRELSNKRFYLVLALSLIFTWLAVLDNTPPFIAFGTIAFPMVMGYFLITWREFPGIILASVVWGIMMLLVNFLAGSLSEQVVRTVILKMSNAIVGVLAFITFEKLVRKRVQ
ncbi:hypothetical protein [Thermococcus alcaliphilus]|uniref:hypothetical protein n=1 Tax=Thermococcus alcaliphilus TaxID=139207 RepID=UPI00209102CC|nr:hypothetical protein [Thermococcus alcaliphilus]MCO6040482.1 hypothetical protein [Thermococcus alcaliphilus]